MVRAILTCLLIAIIAWPHAICLCHSLHAAAHRSSDTDDQCRCPDEEDHDDDECTCCKLRQVLADPTVPMLHDIGDDAVTDLPASRFASADRPTSDTAHRCNDFHFPADQPSLLMLCALRI